MCIYIYNMYCLMICMISCIACLLVPSSCLLLEFVVLGYVLAYSRALAQDLPIPLSPNGGSGNGNQTQT